MADRLILIVPDGADSLIAILDQYMQEWVSHKDGHHTEDTTANTASNTTSTTTNVSPKEVPLALDSAKAALEASSGGDSGRTASHASAGSTTMEKIFRKMSMIAMVDHHAAPDSAPVVKNHAKAYVNSKTAQASANELPFEMHAFEALLTTVMALETQEYNKVNAQVQVILSYFKSGKESSASLHAM